jgi:hypothetical protein
MNKTPHNKKNTHNMDPDGEQNKKIKRQEQKIGILQRYVTYVGDVLSPIWVRRVVQINDGRNWFILGSRYHFLFNFRLFLVVLYIIYETIK